MSENLGLVIGLLCGGFFVLVFIGVGALLVYQSIRSRKKAETSQSWPATTGQITDAHVSHHTSTDSDGDTSDHYSPKVRYSYQVAGQSYEGNKIGFGFQQSFGNASKAQAAITRYPVGGQISVFYDPNNSADAVLERKAGGSNASLMIGVVLLIIGLCMGCPGLAALLIASLSSF
jgi:hypothetical protein